MATMSLTATDVEKFLDKIKPLDEFYQHYRSRMTIAASTIVGFSAVILGWIIKGNSLLANLEGLHNPFREFVYV